MSRWISPLARRGRWPSLLLVPVVAVAVLGLAAASARAQQDLRTWKDTSGQFTIKAKFVSVAEGVVTLQEEDGSSLEIELAKLSEADRKYVAERQKAAASPFRKKAAAPSPFRKKADTSGTK